MSVNTERETLLKELREFGVKNNIPNISDTNALFLKNLITISGSKNVLEIGTANGFSTINLGIAVEENKGKITSIDFSEPSLKMAGENIKLAHLQETVTLCFGNAFDIIPKLEAGFDFVFIDGMMKSSIDFLLTIWDNTIEGGVIIIDDVIKFKEKMGGLEEFLDKNHIEFNILPIDSDDGIMMIIKPNLPLIK